MFAKAALSLTCGLIVACQTAGAVDRGDFGPFKRSLNTTSYGYAVVADPTGTAPTPLVERFEVRPGDCGANSGWNDCATDRERSELGETGTESGEAWYGWSLYVPKDTINVYPTKVALGQFHQHKSHVIWMFQNADGGYYLDRHVPKPAKAYAELIPKGELRGKWHRIEVNAKWTSGPNGFFRVWVDGVEKVDYRGQTCTACTVYFKYGLYRSFLSRYEKANGTDKVPAQVVYYANVRSSDTRAGLAAPRSGK